MYFFLAAFWLYVAICITKPVFKHNYPEYMVDFYKESTRPFWWYLLSDGAKKSILDRELEEYFNDSEDYIHIKNE